jgi:hypothetical protein
MVGSSTHFRPPSQYAAVVRRKFCGKLQPHGRVPILPSVLAQPLFVLVFVMLAYNHVPIVQHQQLNDPLSSQPSWQHGRRCALAIIGFRGNASAIDRPSPASGILSPGR